MEASISNLTGHRAKYDRLSASLPQNEVGVAFVGGGDAIMTGYQELEVLRAFKELRGASIIDIGCGIGRLTSYLLEENVTEYLGLDIIPEILAEAIDAARNGQNFKFAIAENCKLPAADAAADIVCGFSLITHLLDEEIFEYFTEARRVLRSDGIAVFSFLDFENTLHRQKFVQHARVHRHGHGDLTRFTTKSFLSLLAKETGFPVTRFIDPGQIAVRDSGRKILLDGRRAPEVARLGQTVCIMTA